MCHRNSLPKEIINKENVDAVLLFDMAKLINEKSERRHDQNAQDFVLSPTACPVTAQHRFQQQPVVPSIHFNFNRSTH